MLHVHGFADYFFQTAYAEWWSARGYDFYALDLRKYGRSLLPHQTPNYTTDLHDYFPELDAAWERIGAGHSHVVLSGHSTGGLTVPLWADDRRVAGARASCSTRRGSTCRARLLVRHALTPGRHAARRGGSRSGSSRAR